MAQASPVSLALSFPLLALVTACSDPGAADDGGAGATSSTGAASTSEAASEASSGATSEVTSGDATSSGGSTGEVPSPWDGEPLPDGPAGEWEWMDFPDALCRDGSSTGVWVRRGDGDGLVLFFEGGGACFNALTCANNPANYDPWDQGPPSYEIFHLDPAVNPVGDWNIVFVPYCTGDVHAGDRPDQSVPDVEGLQQFVGYRNGAAFLERVVPTFADVGQVLVAGSSAGGFGAGVQYERVAHAFPHARVTLLDDSGPPLPKDVLSPCLQELWSDLWGFDDTLPQGCADCFPSAGGGLSELARYLGEAHPDQRFGLISSAADVTIRFFFGYGADECMPQTINIDAAAFEAGLVELRDSYLGAPASAWGTFYVDDSSDHVWLASRLGTVVGGITLSDWIRQLLAGEATHRGL